MEVNYNLGAAKLESLYGIYDRITHTEPQQGMTEYTASIQQQRPGTAIFPPNDPPQSEVPIEIMEADDARVANRKQIHEAMNNSIDNAAGHVRLYYEAIDAKGMRGPQLLARA